MCQYLDTGKRRTGRDLGELIQLCHLLDFSSELQASTSPSTESTGPICQLSGEGKLAANQKLEIDWRMTRVVPQKWLWACWQRAANYLKNLWEGRVVNIYRAVREWPTVRKCQLHMGLEMSLWLGKLAPPS